MRAKLLIGTALLTTLHVSIAFASEDWRALGSFGYLDAQSIREVGNGKITFITRTEPGPGQDNRAVVGSPPDLRVLRRWETDCIAEFATAVSTYDPVQGWSSSPFGYAPRPQHGLASESKELACSIYQAQKLHPQPSVAEPAPKPVPTQPTVPRVPELSSTATAFAVSPTGYLLTNNHVVESCTEIKAQGPSGGGSARVVASDRRTDLAVLQLSVPTPSSFVFRSSSIRLGDSVVALGFPLRGLLSDGLHVSTGIASALSGLRNDSTKLQISAPVQPGNSGGPLLDESGLVIGVVVAKLDAVAVSKATGDIPQNVNFAVKGEIARSFLDSWNVTYRTALPGKEKRSTSGIAALGRESIYLVQCFR